MLFELFGEFHPLEFEFFGLVGDGLQLVVELAQTLIVAGVVRGHLLFKIGFLLFEFGEFALDCRYALGGFMEGLAGKFRRRRRGSWVSAVADPLAELPAVPSVVEPAVPAEPLFLPLPAPAFSSATDLCRS